MGNVERILVVVIMATIVVILALAIWGLGQDEAGAPPGGGSSSAIEADREVPVTFDSGGSPSTAKGDDESADGSLDAVIPVDTGRESSEKKTPVQPIAVVADGKKPATSPENPPAKLSLSLSPPPPSSGVPLESPIAGMRLYTVAAGDTFSTIAFKVLGDRNQWKQIAEANKDVDQRKLTVGMQILVPARGESPTAAKRSSSAESSSSAPAPVPPLLATSVPSDGAAAEGSGGKRYVTKKGDTLFGIAKRELNDGSKWRSIYEKNRTVLPSEKVVPVGLTLELPASSR